MMEEPFHDIFFNVPLISIDLMLLKRVKKLVDRYLVQILSSSWVDNFLMK